MSARLCRDPVSYDVTGVLRGRPRLRFWFSSGATGEGDTAGDTAGDMDAIKEEEE